jgi:hypothetical protein
MRASRGGIRYTVLGLRNGVTQFLVTGGPLPFNFSRITSPDSSVVIDMLRVTESTIASDPSLGYYNVDNVRVTPAAAAVPAPPAILLVGLGAGCAAVKRVWRRRATA